MDLNTKDEFKPLNLFSVCEDSLSQDMQHRSRKSQIAQTSQKKVKITRMSALLMIDQLKSDFRYPGDFTPRMRTCQNWRPELLIKYFYDNRRSCKEKCSAKRNAVIMQHDKSCSRNFIPKAPKIYSIGLHCNTRSLNDNNDLTSSCNLMRNFRKRFNVIRRPIICKYWTTQSTPTLNLTDVFLKTDTNHRTITINHLGLMDILQNNQTQKNNHYSYYNRSYQHIKEKNGDYISYFIGDNHTADDQSFIADNFTNFSTRRDHKYDKSYPNVIKKDAQIQTLSRKNLRQKKTKKKSKPTNIKISHCKCCDDKSYEEFIANFRSSLQNSNKKKYYKKSSETSSIRILENKCAEYIDKFTAVNQQIEEITATLRETCYSDKNSQNNLENHEKCFPLIFDNIRTNLKQELNGNENKSIIVRENNIPKKKYSSINIKKIIKKSENNRQKNVSEILYSNSINNETLISNKEYSKDTFTSSMNCNRSLNDTFVCDSIETLKKTVYPLNRTCAKKKKIKCHSASHITLDSDLAKNDDEFQEFSIKEEFFDKVHLRSNFATSSSDKYAKDLMKDFADLEELKCRKKIVEKTIGEMAILKDIKRRIDRDFDNPLIEKNNIKDFVTVSQKSSNLDHQFYEIASIKNIAIKGSNFTSSMNFNSAETQIQDTNSTNDFISTDAVSEYSNKNSIPSKYFSCTQFSSLISLTTNEDEFALGFEDQNTYDSNTQSNSNYYDLDYDSKINHSSWNLNPNNCSNLDSSFDIAQYDTCTQNIAPDKCLIETISEPNNTFEVSEDGEDFVENNICREHLYRKNERKLRVELEKRYTADSTLETSKSSRCIGSIDSGVFSSSFIDPYPPENFFNADESELKKKRVGKLDVSSPALDLNSDNSCTDDTLDRKVDDIVKDLTKNLILCERRIRIKLKEMRKSAFKAKNARYPSHTSSCVYKFGRSLCDVYYDFFDSPSCEDERILNISTPSLLSLSDSEVGDRELRCPL